jgi:hypothetical protein
MQEWEHTRLALAGAEPVASLWWIAVTAAERRERKGGEEQRAEGTSEQAG